MADVCEEEEEIARVKVSLIRAVPQTLLRPLAAVSGVICLVFCRRVFGFSRRAGVLLLGEKGVSSLLFRGESLFILRVGG